MRQLHSSLRENHHLKHGGRQQYGLFIKGIGLTMDQALKFWRNEFTKLMDVDKVSIRGGIFGYFGSRDSENIFRVESWIPVLLIHFKIPKIVTPVRAKLAMKM